VDEHGRPRSRIVHPIWEGPIGSIGTWRTSVRAGHRAPSLKARHLERNSCVSLAYIGDVAKPIYVDGQAKLVDDADEKRRFWDLAKSIPPPYGYDPAEVLGSPDEPRFAVLRSRHRESR
jgi:hypothetical protein